MKKCSIFLLSILVLSMFSGILDFGLVPPVYAAEDTFGKTDIGSGTQWNSANIIYGSKFTLSEDGNVSSISWYGSFDSGDSTISCGIYNDNAGAPNVLKGQTQEVTINTTACWWNFTFSPNILLTAGVYWLSAGFEGGGTTNTYYRYDAGTSNQMYYDAFSPPAFNNPAGADGYIDREISIYATYEVDTGDTTPPTYSGLSSSSTTASSSCQFNANFDDETALPSNGQSRFATNNTGEWIWDTPINFTSTPESVSITKTLNSTVDMIVGYRWNITDNAGNLNYTSIQTLTITDADEVSLRSLVFAALALAVIAITLVIVGWKKQK